MNRMSAITFLSLYFLRKDVLDCSGHTTGLAFEATQEFLIMYFLTFVCVILFVVPFKVHFAHISQTLF